MKYTISITETLSREIEIEAKDCDEAYRICRKMYRDEIIVLDSNDFVDVEFEVIKGVPSNE